MKKTGFAIAMTLGMSAAFLMTGCSEQMESPAMKSGGNSVITATISGGADESRTAVDGTQYLHGDVGILWTPQDVVGVYGTETRNARFVNMADKPVGRTQFSGDMADGEKAVYAYYPYSAENDGAEPTALRGRLEAVQQYDPESRELTGDYKVGTERAGAAGEFDFVHLFALLRMDVNAKGTEMAGERLKSVSLRLPEGRTLCGEFEFSAVDGSYKFVSGEGSSIGVELSGVATLGDEAVTAYMTCAPDLKGDDEVVITVRSSGHEATKRAQVAYDFEGHKTYTFRLNMAEFEITELPAEPVEETANCYMITAAGEHDFNGTVMGNGEKGIIPGAGFHTESPYINPVSARLVWEDTNGFITNVRLVDGRVKYTTSGNKGNGVIAVCDAVGKVLWSWHIWGVGDSLPGDEEVTNYNGATFVMMDRTLGGTEPDGYGVMLYQWGRKDPIPNADVYYVDGNAVDIERSYPCEAGDGSLQWMVENPDKIASAGLSTDNNYLWGDTNEADAYTWKYLNNATAEETSGWTDGKTIYDPSPVGYRVASKFAWTGFCSNKMGTNKSATAAAQKGQVKFVKYANGYYFKRNSEDTEGTYYPQTGSRGASTGSLWVSGNSPYKTVNYTASYWSSAPNKNAGQAQCLGIGIYNYKPSVTSAAKYELNTLDFAYRVNAFAVRCMRE